MYLALDLAQSKCKITLQQKVRRGIERKILKLSVDMTPKLLATKERTGKLNFTKTKTFCIPNDNI